MVEELTGRTMALSHVEEPRMGDHQWWISDVRKFQALTTAAGRTRSMPEA